MIMKPYILTLAAAGALILSGCTDDSYLDLDTGSNDLTLNSAITEFAL